MVFYKYNKMKGYFLAIHHTMPFKKNSSVHNPLPTTPRKMQVVVVQGLTKNARAFLHRRFRLITFISALYILRLSLVGCTCGSGWTAAERDIIGNPIPGTAAICSTAVTGEATPSATADTGEAMPAATTDAGETTPAATTAAPHILRVLTVDNPADSLVLRTLCSDLTPEMLASPEYTALAGLMVATVTDPSEDGVGIAGPQVGISRRIVAVQRFDKPGEPFEVYPNIRIIATRGDLCPGPEGCLSVPGRRGNVLRSRDIDIRYTLAPAASAAGTPLALRDTVERIQGFTAVIFQHECDHLDGILYIDKLEPAL